MMNAKNVVFAAVAIRPQPIRELIERIPGFSATSLYHAIGALKKEGLVVVQRRQIGVSPTYRAQKLREIFLKAMSHGVDPSYLVKAPTLALVKALKKPRALAKLAKTCGLHVSRVRRTVRFLRDAGVVDVIRGRPLVLKLTQHPLAKSLSDFVSPPPTAEIPYFGRFPSKRVAAPPEAVERALFEFQDKSITIGKIGLTFKSEGKPHVDFSIISEGPPTPEDILLKQLQTPDGPEFALHTLRASKIDFNRLLELAKKRDMVNEAGCFLDLVHLYAPKAVPGRAIEQFKLNISQKKHLFPKGAKPRELEFEWLQNFEKRWNVELRMPISGIAQEVRNLW